MGSYGIVNIRAISSKNLSYDHRIFDIVGSNEDNIQKLFIINSARSLTLSLTLSNSNSSLLLYALTLT